MVSGDFWVLAAMLLYFVVVLVIGLSYSKRANKSTSDYFLGGRTLGPWLTALSAGASDMSGYLLMGLPGLAYFTGASEAGWTAVGLALGTFLNWTIVAKRIHLYSVRLGNVITLPEFYSKRVKRDDNIVSTIAAIIIFIFFSIYVGSCFVTVGKLFNMLFGINYLTMVILGAFIVFLYTLLGGYLSVCVTDFIQGLLMFAALAIVLVGTIAWAGGVENAANFLKDIPGFLSATESASPILTVTGEQMQEAGVPFFGEPKQFGAIAIISALSWGLGYFGMPHILIRFFGIRSTKDIKASRIIGLTWASISLICAVGIGLIGRSVFPTSLATASASENIFILCSQMILPSFLCGIVVSGILAASMSSSSSYLLMAGASIAENIFRGLIKKDATEDQVMVVARITLVLVFLFGILVAADQNSTIFMVVAYAWAGLGASFGPLTLCSLYYRRLNRAGAIAGMLSGTAVVLIWKNFLTPLGGIFEIYELLPAFIVSLLCIIIVSRLTKAPDRWVLDAFDDYTETHEMEEIREEVEAELAKDSSNK